MAHWIMSGSPKRYRFREATDAGVSLDSWLVSRHLTDMRVGDDFALWLSGPEAGVYALGTIASLPTKGTSGGKFWSDPDDDGKPGHYVGLTTAEYLTGTPILKAELIEDDRFLDATILSQPFAGSPFALTDEQWQAIQDALPPAVTEPAPKRNPPWIRDELILALDLYLRKRPQLPGPRDPDVQALSKTLNNLSIQSLRPDPGRFRNPNGVALKLSNFLPHDPNYAGKGMEAGGRLTKEVWDDYGHRPAELRKLADAIRETLTSEEAPTPTGEPEEYETEEGRILYRLHRARERDPKLIQRKKAQAVSLACEICDFDYEAVYGKHGKGYIEAHHAVPLHITGHGKVTLSDLILICANCHRMAHRGKGFKTQAELRALIKSVRPGGRGL